MIKDKDHIKISWRVLRLLYESIPTAWNPAPNFTMIVSYSLNLLIKLDQLPMISAFFFVSVTLYKEWFVPCKLLLHTLTTVSTAGA
jgi:hypothetical protein